MQDMQVRSLGRENPLEEGMGTHSWILAQKMPWTEEPGGLQSMGLQRVRTQLKRLSTQTQATDYWPYHQEFLIQEVWSEAQELTFLTDPRCRCASPCTIL